MLIRPPCQRALTSPAPGVVHLNQDGHLWPAPELEDWGIGFGYSGNGCRALARLVDTLLDDITAPAARHSDPEAPRAPFELLRDTLSDSTTTCTRSQLLAVRAG